MYFVTKSSVTLLHRHCYVFPSFRYCYTITFTSLPYSLPILTCLNLRQFNTSFAIPIKLHLFSPFQLTAIYPYIYAFFEMYTSDKLYSSPLHFALPLLVNGRCRYILRHRHHAVIPLASSGAHHCPPPPPQNLRLFLLH